MLTKPLGLLLLLLGMGSSVSAAEPQATFTLVKGWLEVSVQHDGVGVKDTRIRVLDFAGQTLAEGECDEEGRGSFPLPAGSAYLVGVTIPGKKTEADIITLRSDGKTITPPRVLLSFSKPCCRLTFSSQPDGDESEAESPRLEKPSIAWIMLGVSGACMVAAGMMLMCFRRP